MISGSPRFLTDSLPNLADPSVLEEVDSDSSSFNSVDEIELIVGEDSHKGFTDFTSLINLESVLFLESCDCVVRMLISCVLNNDIGVGVASLVAGTVGLVDGDD